MKFVKFKTSLFLLLLLALPNLVLGSEKTAMDYWRDTGLTMKVFEDNVTPVCHASTRNFLGCMLAINRLAGMLDPPQRLTTDEEKALDSPALGKKLENWIGGLSSYELKQIVVKTAKEAKKLSEKNRQTRSTALQNLFRSGNPIPFVTIIEALKKKALVGKHRNDEAYFTSLLFNGYYEAANDPHTRIETVAYHQQTVQNPGKHYAGIGITLMLTPDKKAIHVLDVVPGGPADGAGLKWNDQITQVDEKSFESLNDEQKLTTLKGPIGSTVNLTVLRKKQTLHFTLERENVNVANVRSTLIRHLGPPIGLIRLGDFRDQNAAKSIHSEINKLTRQGATGLILDLRSNPGGLVNAATDIGSLFVGDEVMVKMQPLAHNPNNEVFSYPTSHLSMATELPMVTLIDGHSASASELLSGALQDYQRSWIVGDRSFGKGSAQSFQEWKVKDFDANGKIRIFATNMIYHLPSGRTPQILGVIPDFEVGPTPAVSNEETFFLREEDLYENAIPIKSEPWQQPRREAVLKINDCRNRSKMAEALFSHPNESFESSPDYRVLVAEEILKCAAETDLNES